MESQDLRAARFSGLLESGMSKEDAWKLLVFEILVNAGVIIPERSELSSASTRLESIQFPIVEAKLLKVIRIEPSEEERIRAVLKSSRAEAAAAKSDAPNESSVIRQAIRLGLDELERQRSRR